MVMVAQKCECTTTIEVELFKEVLKMANMVNFMLDAFLTIFKKDLFANVPW